MGLDEQDWWKWHVVGLSVTLGEMPHLESIQVALLEEAGKPLSGPPNTAIWSRWCKGKPGFSGWAGQA